MTNSYKRLFLIEIFHEYFRDGKCNDLVIEPTAETKEYFKGMGLLWRKTENTCIALIKENGSNEPFINTPPQKHFRDQYGNTVFRFYINIKNHLFYNYTNTNIVSGTGKKFYFSNLADNSVSGFNYISQPIPAHANTIVYPPGTLVSDSNGVVFESIKLHTSTAATELADDSLWLPKGMRFQPVPIEEWAAAVLYEKGKRVLEPGTSNVYEAVEKHVSLTDADLADTAKWTPRSVGEMQYTSPADLLDTCARSTTITIPAATKAEIVVYAFNYNPSAPDFDQQVGETITEEYEEEKTSVQVDMSSYNPGRYLLEVNGVTKAIYYDPEFAGGNVFGVIEIFNHLPASNAYSFLDANEKIKDLRYVLQFPNRRVLWKYLRSDSRAEEIKDVVDPDYAFVLSGNAFVSPTPLPLSETPNSSFELTFSSSDFRLFPLPNPNPVSLSKCNQDGYDYLCSEIYLNY